VECSQKNEQEFPVKNLQTPGPVGTSVTFWLSLKQMLCMVPTACQGNFYIFFAQNCVLFKNNLFYSNFVPNTLYSLMKYL
jgi:hypothetical protein